MLEQIEILISLRLIDSKNKDKWETFAHDDNKHKDDYHSRVKPQIKAKLSGKLKKIFGNNADIEIRDSEIYIVSQVVDEKTGKKIKKRALAGLPIEDYFRRVSKLLFLDIFEAEIVNFQIVSAIISEGNKVAMHCIITFLEQEE